MRDEFWQERAVRLKECAYLGMTKREAADDVGLSFSTVCTYSKRFNIPFAKGKRSIVNDEARRKMLVGLATEGLTVAEAAKKLGKSYHTVGAWARAANVVFPRPVADPTHNERADTMAAMYRAGKTLEEIGQVYSITRERVRQIITKVHGLTAENGGQALKARFSRAQRRAEKEAECYVKHGCSRSQLKELRDIGREMSKQGFCRERTPIGAFSRQRCNARKRGIEWTLTLWDWWTIWQESGHWDERGRTADAYVMCRFRDEGAYEIGNVYVATARHNVTMQPNNPYRKSHPDFETAMAEKAARRTTTVRYRTVCAVGGCDKPHYAHGWCNNHYYHFVTKPRQAERVAAA